jgi:Ribonuclease G/E
MEMAEIPKTPEHEKLKAIVDQTQPAGEFLEWLEDQGYYLARNDEHGRPWALHKDVQTLLAEWQGIDRAKLEREKKALLAYVRATQTEA